MKKKFVLGIGSQRAGSTFLGRLLDHSPQVSLHPLKELHYFDTLFGVRQEKALKDFSRNQLTREINRLCTASNTNFFNRRWQWYINSNFELFSKPVSEISYFDLFHDSFLSDEIKIVGESTPEYMLLSREQIKQVKNTIGDAHIILLCRNPIKRIISAFRLLIEYSHKDATEKNLDELFLNLLNDKNHWLENQMKYSNYRRAKERYEESFEHVLLLAYDDLIANKQSIVNQTSKFLDIEFESDILTLFDKRINSLQLKYSPNQEVLSRLENIFQILNEDANDLLETSLSH